MADNKILVIDDEEIIRLSCRRALSAQGFNVVTAADGLEGLALLGKSSYDLIILDIKMPNMDGIEFLETLRGMPQSGRRVVIITGYSSIETASEAQKMGAWGYLEKPFAPDTLASTVRAALSP